MGLIIPGFTPDTLGEIYEYRPTINEWCIAAGIFGAAPMASSPASAQASSR